MSEEKDKNIMNFDYLEFHLKEELKNFIDESSYELNLFSPKSPFLKDKTDYKRLIEHLEEALKKAHQLYSMEKIRKDFESERKGESY